MRNGLITAALLILTAAVCPYKPVTIFVAWMAGVGTVLSFDDVINAVAQKRSAQQADKEQP